MRHFPSTFPVQPAADNPPRGVMPATRHDGPRKDGNHVSSCASFPCHFDMDPNVHEPIDWMCGKRIMFKPWKLMADPEHRAQMRKVSVTHRRKIDLGAAKVLGKMDWMIVPPRQDVES